MDSPVICTLMPSELYAVSLQTKVFDIWQGAMPQKPLISTLVKDDYMYQVTRAVSKEAVCNNAGVASLIMLGPHWKRPLLVECHGGKLVVLSQYGD